MIDRLEELLGKSPPAGPMLSMGAVPEEYFLINGSAREPEPVSPALVGKLKSLGIFYVYAGKLEFNAMASRILQDMREGGAALEEEGFRARVEEGKRLYHNEHLEFWPEPEMDLPE
jgi:hypothetical protein